MKLKTFRELPNKNNVKDILDCIRNYIFFDFIKDTNEINDKKVLEKRIIQLYIKIVVDDSALINFLDQINKAANYLEKDLEFFLESSETIKSYNDIIFTSTGFKAILYYRVAHIFHKHGEFFISKLISELAYLETGIDIHPGAVIGKYFFIEDGKDIVIGGTSIVGHHVKIYKNVTLGDLSVSCVLESKKRHPTIGNYVTIYDNVFIYGGTTVIGDNTMVGPNLVVFNSINN